MIIFGTVCRQGWLDDPAITGLVIPEHRERVRIAPELRNTSYHQLLELPETAHARNRSTEVLETRDGGGAS